MNDPRAADEQQAVTIVGAGPAGMAAATRLARAGMRPVVLDRAMNAGGQIYRDIGTTRQRDALLGPDYVRGRALHEAFMAACTRGDIDYRPASHLWWAERGDQGCWLGILTGEYNRTLHTRRLMIAGGAMERGWPFPGWQRPGVMTAGAGQILLKQAGLIPDVPVVLAGCGPLLYLLAWQYLRAGVRPLAVLDLAGPERYRQVLAHPRRALQGRTYLYKGVRMIAALKRAGIPVHQQVTALSAEGDEHGALEAVSFTRDGVTHRLPAGLLLTHFGVVPDPQLPRALNLPQRWHDGQQCFITERNEHFEGAPGIACVGDGAAIGGARNAELEGALAATHLLLEHQATSALREEQHRLHQRWRHEQAVRPLLEALFALPDDWLERQPADTLICRCESVSRHELITAIDQGGLGPNQLKAFTRCGMGPCQGRLCGDNITRLVAGHCQQSPDQVGYLQVRPPLVSMTLGELAGEPSTDTSLHVHDG
ncbi:FAD-dependent oxidoreductase [Kushneria phosphatilytica]|uniref:NAD(P)-binding protein n=1 Tax=Kushneria phosphatilytica TaxID=657387 RepID=A0A1S1NUM7_9GAMM|nr:FAD-dependent oxidoreductase [Kushneria phosphatilytica]OHV08459.1 hypothetical protein BH688_14265 [Kushneria phosphatilytica]QEL09889.1 NAD(P)-binding protein [Kushneria phosphatilytica]